METGKLINSISIRLRRRAQLVQKKFDIGSAQGSILDYVIVRSTRKSVYQKDIEAEFGLRSSTVTEMLNSLEEKGLIKRVADEQDGRKKKIIFMDKAFSIKDALRKEINETESLLLKGISDDELKAFTATARKMLNNLESEESKENHETAD